MATIQENIETIKSATADIKTAIVDKGGTIEGDITTWAGAISALSGGGILEGDLKQGSFFANKLNGLLFGNPNYVWSSTPEIVHSNYLSMNTLPIMIGIEEKTTGTSNVDTGIYDKSYVNTSDDCLSGSVNVEITYSNNIQISIGSAVGMAQTASKKLKIIVFISDGVSYDVDYFYVQGLAYVCILKGTPITLADGTTKNIEDVTYNDKLKVWNFDEGEYGEANPLWIKKAETALYYYHCEFENGLKLDLVGSNGKCHRLFSVTKNSFESATDCVGDEIYTEQGITRLMSCEMVIGDCEYYNIITNHHMNMFANNILTSCRYNNIYPIKDMKFIIDKDREYIDYERYSNVPLQFFVGMRLYKQSIPVEDTNAYIANMLSRQQTLQDYEGNEVVETDPEKIEVGWVDEDGNVYGFRRYMLGQQNHGTLAQYICKKLDIEPQHNGGYERALELLGYVRFSKQYYAKDNTRSNINAKQYKQLHRFMKANNIANIKERNVYGKPTTINQIEILTHENDIL